MSQRLLQSICGFPGKEKAPKAAEKAAAKDHFIPVFVSSEFVYSCICVFVSSVFVYLCISQRKESRDGAAEHQAAAAQNHFLSSDGNSLACVLFFCENFELLCAKCCAGL